MASLSLKHIYKVYDGGVKAVNDFCMEIEDKEFIVFVGPSGCGKSTTLRMIAGLEEITAGELMIGDDVVNDVEPKDRNIAMVFQNYALYPHMTVRENMAFALRLRKDLSEEEIMRRVDEAAAKLDITQFLERKPRALSGGQRQRVSLGRAIVRSPKVFLLDEPLSNLDAKLRAQMRTEIAKLHKQLATTFIYVTHDQVEAMTMGTRIVVMKFGVVQQIDTPKNLYDYPGNKFVASFIGTPQMNFFEATLKRLNADQVEITFAKDRKVIVPAECLVKAKKEYFDGETKVIMGIRPEDVHIEEDFVAANKNTAIDCNIGIIEALGSESIVYCELDQSKETISESDTRLVLKVDPRKTFEIDQQITVALDPTRLHLFDKETEVTIMPRIPELNVLKGMVKGGTLDINGKKFELPEAMALADGAYEVTIPSNAFIFEQAPAAAETFAGEKYDFEVCEILPKFQKDSFTNDLIPANHAAFAHEGLKGYVKLPVRSCEKIGKTTLLRLDLGGESVFAIGAECAESGDTVMTGIDWKKVSVKAEGAQEETLKALEFTNVLSGKMVRERADKEEFNFGLTMGDVTFFTTDYIQKKLFNAAGRKAFSINLDYDFTPYDVMIAPEGMSATVTAIYNYGQETFASCTVGDKTVNVLLRPNDNVAVGDNVKLTVDVSAMGIVEADRGIRLI